MPAIVECDCIPELAIPQKLDQIFCQGAEANVLLESINDAIGGGGTSDQYDSTVLRLTTASASIPIGTLGWSVAVISGTVTVGGQSIPVGGSVQGGGYGGRTLKTAIVVDATAGDAIVTLDTPG